MRFVIGEDATVGRWVARRIPQIGTVDRFGAPGTWKAIGVTDDAGLALGAGVYHAWNPTQGNIEMSIAGRPGWLTRRSLRVLIGFPFVELCCQRVTTIVAASNERSLRLAQGLGWQVEGRVRRGFGAEDAIILGLLHGEARRWLGGKNGQQQ